MTQVPTVAQVLAELSPLPVAEGTVTAFTTGWTKAYYYDPLTGQKTTFASPPSVVATGENRQGSPPTITAPTISIPALELPELPDVTIPVTTIPTNNLQALVGYRFTCGFAVAGICDGLNKLMALWDQALYDLINMVETVNSLLAQARQDLLNTLAAISQFRDNTQTALDSYQQFIQNSVNQGLSQVIPALYDSIGIPLIDILTPVQIRNIATDSFEFNALSAGYTIHYVAIGPKVAV
jgi:hypothetical protein